MSVNGLIEEIDTNLIQYGRAGDAIHEIKATLSVSLLRLYPTEASFDESKDHIREKILEGFSEEKQALLKMTPKDALDDGKSRLRQNALAVLNSLLRKLKIVCYNKPSKKSKLCVANI